MTPETQKQISKEEILAKRISIFPSDGDMTDESIKRNVYAAMDEYAKVWAEKYEAEKARADKAEETLNTFGVKVDMLPIYCVNRVEVIDEAGRSYVNWNNKNVIYIEFQDEGRTLKVFIEKRK